VVSKTNTAAAYSDASARIKATQPQSMIYCNSAVLRRSSIKLARGLEGFGVLLGHWLAVISTTSSFGAISRVCTSANNLDMTKNPGATSPRRLRWMDPLVVASRASKARA